MGFMGYIWLGALIIFVVGEGITVGTLVSIWFAGGALVALILEFFGVEVWIQVTAFILVSGLLLAMTRPIIKKYITRERYATNADRIIGMIGVVTQDINNVSAAGEVKVDGKFWSARSESGREIPLGAQVNIVTIEGVKLIVAETAKQPQ